MRFDDEWVDEVKRAMSACKVYVLEGSIASSHLTVRNVSYRFLFYPVYWIAYNQMTGNLTSQAATMEVCG